MKREIISYKAKREAIMPTFGFSMALLCLVVVTICDAETLGADINTSAGATIYWIVKGICMLCIPLMVYLLSKFIKQLLHGELLLKISEDGIYLCFYQEAIPTIKYEDIERISYKEYPGNEQYIIFLFLTDPNKYLTPKQLERNAHAKSKIPESGDVFIPSIFIKEKKEEVIELINYYIDRSH